MKFRIILKLIPLLLVGIILLYFHLRGSRNFRLLYSTQVNSLIIEKNNWQVRTTEFYLDNGLRLYSTYANNYDLMIGDSISKLSNSKYYEVHRKINDSYIKMYVYEIYK